MTFVFAPGKSTVSTIKPDISVAFVSFILVLCCIFLYAGCLMLLLQPIVCLETEEEGVV